MNNELFFLVYQALNSPVFLCVIILFSIASKGFVIGKLIAPGIRAKYGQCALFFLLGALGCSFFGDIAWLFKIAQSHTNLFSYKLALFSIRIAWAFLIFQYHFLTLFIYALLDQRFKLSWLQKILLLVSTICAGYFLYLAFGSYHMFATKAERDLARGLGSISLLEFSLMGYIVNYYNLIHIGLLLLHVVARLRADRIPHVLRKQLFAFVVWLLCPYAIIDIMQGFLFDIEPIKSSIHLMVSVSTLMLVFAILYCLRSVMHLRFLNRSYGIKSEVQLNFMYNFKAFLAQLSEIKSIKELGCVVQSFLNEEFNIPVSSTHVYLRHQGEGSERYAREVEPVVERFVAARIECKSPSLPLLVYDEIELQNFYQHNLEKQEMLEFMDDINAAVFIPLYLHDTLVGYVIIDKEARPNGHFKEIECNGMLILASYLASITDLLHNRNKESYIIKQKNMKEAFYRRHQEINLYRETISYFMEQSNSNGIGVIFYRKNRFTLGNEAASHFVPFVTEQHPRDPLVKKLKNVVTQVQQYKSSYSLFSQDAKGRIIKICGMPQDNQGVIITLSYPGIADIVSERLAVLHDHAKWDWLLYLQTTQAGNLVEHYLPGDTPTLIAAKIKLLQTALGKHNLWLDTPHEDLAATAELIHQISLRETMHSIELVEPEKNSTIFEMLFGIQEGQKPLMEHLHTVGTLFIRNVHFLQKNTQEQLVQLMRYGFYNVHGTSRHQESDVRIICTSHQNLKNLVRDEVVDIQLYNQLKANKHSLPSPALLDEDEFYVFVDSCVQQAVAQEIFSHFLYLSEKDKQSLFREHISSFAVLKNRIFQLLVQKTKESQLQEDQLFDPAYAINDPELIKAARLGKHALKDSKMMSILLEKFKSQSKIATFLGVNRSSVSRRCKAYGLE